MLLFFYFYNSLHYFFSLAVQFSNGENEWFFFIYMDMNIDNVHNKAIERGGDEIGIWQSIGDRKCVEDTNGNTLATKTTFIYFSGCPSHRKRTHWRINEFRLPIQFYNLHNSKVSLFLFRINHVFGLRFVMQCVTIIFKSNLHV